ncbi:GNAT family N-acetyltransferase [Plantactinospora sp. KBS50]|uniref:GNAT family N-acetyltransferase n=1 Tax=Plantactinospora sp. KBS50 TaxID=2024580 RepID=UPI000BAB14C5|nr:GNAT family N-acetyltransferase [Plantactinospora sp. KBS50]ASW57742.1 GNAT family N-acetyltransferase [Plantactinospora sp. KBS50]
MRNGLRAVGDDDRDLLLGWRNHPEVRRVSLTTHEIRADEHRAWWDAVRRDPARRVLVYEHAGVPAGAVVFADLPGPDGSPAADGPVERTGSWGYYLDLAGLRERGELLPAWLGLQDAAVRYAFDDLRLDRLGGETLADNAQVLALHRRFGFRATRRYERPVDGVPREVVWTELGAADRRPRIPTSTGGTRAAQ